MSLLAAIDTWAVLYGRRPRTWALKAARFGARASRCRRNLQQDELQHQVMTTLYWLELSSAGGPLSLAGNPNHAAFEFTFVSEQARLLMDQLMPANVEPTRFCATDGEGAPDLLAHFRVSPAQAGRPDLDLQ